ncbi:LysR family transcriptional regulator [Peribacillus butanolivorans]|uniref:LysR family transcriptional regulator n=1 Tax=Peribacillus butanolivorans TaxID=421767 RepID=A0AAX0RX58_9BACI|nr:LysR family transcriptional regulator [Peribacillus butanolivorans]PEJ27232.1 LysR family transcriptional regulator [Peribacillus butanolivorans]
MKEQDCLLIVAIYEDQSITKAAERLFISQPALTYRIKQLEQEFGIKIIKREGNKIIFTAEGEYLVKFSNNLLLEISKLKDQFQNMSIEATGLLRIGVSSNFSLYKLPPIIQDFLQLYPKVQLKVNTGWSSEIMQLLTKNEIQIGIVTGDYNWFEEKVLLYQDPLTIISKEQINIKNIPNLPRVDYVPNNLTNKSQKPSNPLTKLIENWWQESFNAPPLINMVVDKVETCKEMVKKHLGYSIIPRSCIRESDDFYTYDLKDENDNPIYRKTWMVYRKSSLELSAVNKFVDYLTIALL